jgi:hypothetical protein
MACVDVSRSIINVRRGVDEVLRSSSCFISLQSSNHMDFESENSSFTHERRFKTKMNIIDATRTSQFII